MKIKSILMIIGALAVITACKKQSMQLGEMTPECAVITIQPDSVSLKSSYPATIKGRQDIEIRPKISGFITKLCVDEGSVVRKGQPLFIIDRVQYEEAVRAAKAAIQVAKANIATQQITVDSKRELLKKNIISQNDMQMAENQLASLKATLAQAKANLITAQQNLDFTTVTSPANGVVGSIPYRVGSLVSSASAQPLTVVSDISEMFVYFSVTEKQLLEMTRQDGSSKGVLNNMPQVELQLIDGSLYDRSGKVETISGVIDQTTGTVSMRATFANPNSLLRSGGTGVILVPYRKNDALQIPQKATYELQDKKFVYVLQKDGTVKNTEIGILNVDNGQNYVVTSGLKVGDKVVIENVNQLKDGMKIKALTPAESEKKFQQALEDAKK